MGIVLDITFHEMELAAYSNCYHNIVLGLLKRMQFPINRDSSPLVFAASRMRLNCPYLEKFKKHVLNYILISIDLDSSNIFVLKINT